MIPNLVNTAIGIWLVYAGALDPAEMAARPLVLASGVVIFALAIWAYQGDYLKWPATIAGVVGACLVMYAGFRLSESSAFVSFWVAIFAGITVAVASLWSALYRRPSTPEYSSGNIRQPPASPRSQSTEERK
jgi:hypothetical protein